MKSAGLMLKPKLKNKHELASDILKKKRIQLISDFLNGKETSFLEKHSSILDDFFRLSFEKSMIGPRMGIYKNPYVIIALGGYGREEQCLHSDVDILFLFKKNVPIEAEELIREIIYPLWDIGYEVGHATRSLKECICIACDDYGVMTSILDARFICGMSPLYSELMEQVRKKVIGNRSGTIINMLIERNRERHKHFGDCTYLLEPNLKEGQGGLRDYHTMLWIARIKFNLKQPRDFEYYGYLSHDEFQAIEKALNFIWKVRNNLHYLTGRKCDQLYFEQQIKLAEILGFKEENGQQPVEKFLGNLHGQMDFLKQQHLMFLYEQGYSQKRKRKFFIKTKEGLQTKFDGVEIRRGRLNFVSTKKIVNSPDLLIKIFQESARLKLPISAEAKRVVKEFGYLVDENFRNSRPVIKSFEKILVTPAPAFNVLNQMLNTEFLIRFIPEFKRIVNRIQYDEYHICPVDKHLLLTVQVIKKFGTPEDITKTQLCGQLYKEIKNKKILLWAALLHDIGKGDPSERHSDKGAVIVSEILKAKGYRPKEIETASFLVKQHLLLTKTAARRDINDEGTAIALAKTIKEIEWLKMLYLISVADSISTGPRAWNDWSLALLRDLFLKILNIMQNGELATKEAVETVEKKKEKVLSSAGTPEEKQVLESLFNFMSPRYLIGTNADDIIEHISLYKTLGKDNFVWKIDKSSDTDTRTVTICAKDEPGLISKIAGVLTLNGINILDTFVYTWRNNIALDIFKVEPPLDRLFENERWNKAEKKLKSALSGELNLAEELKEKMSAYRLSKINIIKKPNKIVVDNNSSSFFTIIEVFTYDFPGLLFRITDTLVKCRLDVWIAKIATKIDQVVDVFYVRDFDGQKVDSEKHVAEIKKAIEDILPGIDE